MVSMTVLGTSGPFTRAERDALPDDGRRHELIDGLLVVNPSPGRNHQRVVLALTMLLHDACPGHLEVVVGPFDVTLADDTVVVPDILVARLSDLTERDLPTAPLLAVEVLSPSTRRYDLMTKRSRYEDAGTGSYWVIDPDDLTLTAWQLVDRQYAEVARVTGEEEWAASLPFPVTVCPARLRG